jgi:hypothetical protein
MKMHNESLQNQNKKAANLSSENLAKLMYFGVTVTNQNYIMKKLRAT